MDLSADLAASNESSVEFMKTELRLAHTLLDVAETTKIAEHRLKSHEDTQKAYRGLLKFLPRLQLSAEQQLDFDQEVTKLKHRMLLAGIEL